MIEYPTFSPFTQEQLGFYVYALRDPRDSHIFYIGKGQGERVLAHARGALTGAGDESLKSGQIRAIHESGQAVEAFILRHGLKSNENALDTEAALLGLLALMDHNNNTMYRLTNVMGGHHERLRGVVEVSIVNSLFDAPQAPEIIDPVLLFRIPQLWTPQMSSEALYEATRGWWKLGPKREHARYAMAVSGGVIRGVYRITSWRPRAEGDRDWRDDAEGKRLRWGFDGESAPELSRYLNTSVRHLFKQGNASPFIYLNCDSAKKVGRS